jgi:hypothetical protein
MNRVAGRSLREFGVPLSANHRRFPNAARLRCAPILAQPLDKLALELYFSEFFATN